MAKLWGSCEARLKIYLWRTYDSTIVDERKTEVQNGVVLALRFRYLGVKSKIQHFL